MQISAGFTQQYGGLICVFAAEEFGLGFLVKKFEQEGLGLFNFTSVGGVSL